MEIRPLTKEQLEEGLGEELLQIGVNIYSTKDGMIVRPYAGIEVTRIKKAFDYSAYDGSPWQPGQSVDVGLFKVNSTESAKSVLEQSRDMFPMLGLWDQHKEPYESTIERAKRKNRERAERFRARSQG